MKILFLTYYFPYPMLNGAQLRSYNVVKLLGERHEIHLFGLLGDGVGDDDIRHMKAFCSSVSCASLPDRNSVGKYLAGWGSPLPYKVLNAYHPRIHKDLRELAARIRFDLVFIDHTFMAEYNLFDLHIPHVVTLLNMEYRILEKYAQGPLGIRKMYGVHQKNKMKQYELNLSRSFSGCVYVSENERREAAQWNPQGVGGCFPNGVDVKLFSPIPGEDHHPPRLAFSGNFTNYPNVEAVQYFLRDVFPLIRGKITGVKFDVVGYNPRSLFKSTADGSVRIVGRVERTQDWIAPADVVVVPLQTGAGTKLKVLESMAMGKAIVSSSVGVEGLKVTDGEDVFIADEPKRFAACVSRLLSDGELRKKMGRAARATAVRLYSWEPIVARLDQFIRMIAEKKDNPTLSQNEREARLTGVASPREV